MSSIALSSIAQGTLDAVLALGTKQDAIERLLRQMLKGLECLMAVLDDLTTRVQNNNDLIDSAITLIGGLRQAIIDAGTDPTKLQALTDSLAAKDQELADAVAANTPA